MPPIGVRAGLGAPDEHAQPKLVQARPGWWPVASPVRRLLPGDSEQAELRMATLPASRGSGDTLLAGSTQSFFPLAPLLLTCF